MVDSRPQLFYISIHLLIIFLNQLDYLFILFNNTIIRTNLLTDIVDRLADILNSVFDHDLFLLDVMVSIIDQLFRFLTDLFHLAIVIFYLLLLLIYFIVLLVYQLFRLLDLRLLLANILFYFINWNIQQYYLFILMFHLIFITTFRPFLAQ